MSHPTEQRNSALDGLRGLAALSVVFYHALLHREDLINSVLIAPIQNLSGSEAILQKLFLTLFNGHSAVLLFFVLSGFVLARSLERCTGSFAGISLNFTLTRMFRLYPALMFCIAVYYSLASLYAWAGWSGMPTPDLRAALLNASLLDTSLHGPSTTLQAEMMAIPFLLASFFIGKRFGSAGLLCCLVFTVFAFENPQLLIWKWPHMNAWLPAFILGVVIADRRLANFFQGISGSTLYLLAVLFVCLRSVTYMNAGSTTLAQTLLGGALVGTVYYAAPQLGFIRFLNSRPLQFLGRISYSLYLLNVPALMIIWSLTAGTDLYPLYPLSTAWGVGIAATLLTLPAAAFSQRLFEQGGMQLWQAIRDRQGLLTRNA